jgi:hypothetical protein
MDANCISGVYVQLIIQWDPNQLITWSLVAIGILITLWQGWDCTQLYLSQPVQVEDRFVRLADLPAPIQLSICQVWNMVGPTSNMSSSFSLLYSSANTTNQTADFWRELDARGSDDFSPLSDLLEEIGFWNDSSGSWDLIYDSQGTSINASLIDRAIYPYEDNSTLACYTLRPGLANFGTKFRLVTTLYMEISKESMFTWKFCLSLVSKVRE